MVCPTSELRVRADGDRVLQVLRNLLSNAIKFSQAESRVRVSAVAEGEFVRLSVQDHGKGVPENGLASIFDRFIQMEPSDAMAGSGLGLSICKALVEQMGGRIWAESRVGLGSTFHFTLPSA